ncbi:MAG: Ig-like domain-containing protein [Bacteroidales bacterium]|jgi:hypothetical protein|nr:Ig-like domain-containing protein [Bacteroidales bacterium]
MKRTRNITVLFPLLVLLAGCGDKPSPIWSVELSHPSLTLYRDQALSLWVNCQPPDAQPPAFRFDSDNLNVATVTPDGLVTGVHVGTCRITVTGGGYSDTCTVTVAPQSPFAFTEPHIQPGYTKAQVRALEERPLIRESRTELIYAGENSKVAKITYLFQNNLLSSVIVELACTDCMEDVKTFLTERHLYLETNYNSNMVFQTDITASPDNSAYRNNKVYVELVTGSRWYSAGSWLLQKQHNGEQVAASGMGYFFNIVFGY